MPEMEIDVLIQTDPVAKQLSAELGWKRIDQSYNDVNIKKTRATPMPINTTTKWRGCKSSSMTEGPCWKGKPSRTKRSSLIYSEVIRLQAVLQPLRRPESSKGKNRRDGGTG